MLRWREWLHGLFRTKESFSSKTDWITVSASDKVFSGEVTLAANTWSFVNFTTPFEYDGTSNLVLVVDDNTGGYSYSPHLACSVFNTSSTQAIYIYSDGTNYNPASPTTSQNSNYATLAVKNHILMGIESGEPQETMSFTLDDGWNWWAPNIDITLADFEAAIGSNGVSIISQDGLTASYSNIGWGGDLTAIEVGKMYMVQTNAACTITVSGYVVDPADYPVTVYPGTNWMGFIGTEEMSLDEAFVNFTPTNMDNIKTRNGTAVYYQGKGWRGRVSTLTPGEGFIYTSKKSTSQTFTYPSAQ